MNPMSPSLLGRALAVLCVIATPDGGAFDAKAVISPARAYHRADRL